MSRKGIYRALCDRCGFEYYNYQLQKEWTGLMVCHGCFEVRHAQDFIKIRPDTNRLPWTRPEPADVEVSNSFDTSLRSCTPLGIFATAGFAVAGCAVAGSTLPGITTETDTIDDGDPNLIFDLPLSDLGSGEVSLVYTEGHGTPTFTRATTATTVNSVGTIVSVAANVPRSYYDPTTREYMGYLAEGARTNLCLQSEDLATTWVNGNSTESTNAVASPDGNTTADKLVEDATAGVSHMIRQDVTATADVSYAVSVFVKAAERTWVRLLVSNGAQSFGRYFDVGTGAEGSSSTAGTGTFTSSSIKAYPNGWYRISVVGTIGSGATAIRINIQLATANNTASYDGDGTSGLYVWGAQFENNVSFASSYIPTTTASVTRNGDQLLYPVSRNVDETVGTAYAELGLEFTTNDGFAHIALSIEDANGRLFYSTTNAVSTEIRMFDGTTANTKTGLTDMNTSSRKRACTWGGTSTAITGDGQVPSRASFDGNMGGGTSTNIGVGVGGDGNNHWFGTVKNVKIWNRHYDYDELEDLTD